MTDCEHGKVYYMDFANQPRAFENCPMCQRDKALADVDEARTEDARAFEKRLEDAYARNRAVTAERDAALSKLEECQKEYAEYRRLAESFRDGVAEQQDVTRQANASVRAVLEGKLEECQKELAGTKVIAEMRASRLDEAHRRMRGLFVTIRQREGMSLAEAQEAWEKHGKRNLIGENAVVVETAPSTNSGPISSELVVERQWS